MAMQILFAFFEIKNILEVLLFLNINFKKMGFLRFN